MKVLITGGCGFIGSHIAEYHIDKGDEVKIIDNLSTGSIENIKTFVNNPLLQFDNTSLLTASGLETTVAWADRIYHMASVMGVYRVLANPINVLSDNIICYERLLKAIATTKSKARLIVASSSSVYGHSSKSLLNENDSLILNAITHPLRGYAISKITIEELTHSYYLEYNIPFTLIRLFNTIGPRQTGRYGMVVPRFIEQARLGQPLTVFGDGIQTRSFCDVRDVVNMVNLIAENLDTIGEIINVGQDIEITINDLATLVCNSANIPVQIKHISYNEAYGISMTDISQRRPDLAKLFKSINYKHQWTLEQTIENLTEAARSY